MKVVYKMRRLLIYKKSIKILIILLNLRLTLVIYLDKFNKKKVKIMKKKIKIFFSN